MARTTAEERLKTFDADPRKSRTLPSYYYRTPEIYEREREAIFFKTWQYAGFTGDLTEPGSFITCSVLDQGLFVVRQKDGSLRGFYNVCSHRGSELLEGRGKRSKISCPIHGWTYDLGGEVVGAPGFSKERGVDLEPLCLKEVRVEMLASFVFVNLDPEAKSLKSQTPGLEEEIVANWPELEKMTLVARQDGEIVANWKLITDNFADAFHALVGHPEMDTVISYDSLHWTIPEEGIHLNLRGAPGSFDCKFYRLTPDDEEKEFRIYLIFPNTIFIVYPGPANFGVMTSSPTGMERSLQTSEVYLMEDPPGENAQAMLDYLDDRANPEDFRIFEHVQKGMRSRAYTNGYYSVDESFGIFSEQQGHRMHMTYLEAMGELPSNRR